MRYLGGKFHTRKYIAPIIQNYINENTIYIEPMIGAANIFSEIKASKKIGADIHPDLIEMYKALQNGWIPPEYISEQEYKDLRNAEVSALRGFVGFAASFGGKWFGGYARDHKGSRNFAKVGSSGLMKRVSLMDIANCEFRNISYLDLTNEINNNNVIYCDPPYANTTKYSSGKFDHAVFWQWIREQSIKCPVIVSEYTAPEDFDCILEIPTKTGLRDVNYQHIDRTERLFMYREGIK